jgi:hypothetical protein
MKSRANRLDCNCRALGRPPGAAHTRRPGRAPAQSSALNSDSPQTLARRAASQSPASGQPAQPQSALPPPDKHAYAPPSCSTNCSKSHATPITIHGSSAGQARGVRKGDRSAKHAGGVDGSQQLRAVLTGLPSTGCLHTAGSINFERPAPLGPRACGLVQNGAQELSSKNQRFCGVTWLMQAKCGQLRALGERKHVPPPGHGMSIATNSSVWLATLPGLFEVRQRSPLAPEPRLQGRCCQCKLQHLLEPQGPLPAKK